MTQVHDTTLPADPAVDVLLQYKADCCCDLAVYKYTELNWQYADLGM